MTRLLIAGATGLVGGQVLMQALADARVSQIIAPTRRPLPRHPKLLNPVTDFTTTDWQEGWTAIDGLVSALGTTRKQAKSQQAFRAVDLHLPQAIAKLARGRGATRLALVSSGMADATSRFFYLRMKGELEEALKAMDYPSLTILRPGLLTGGRAEPRFGEETAEKILRPLQWLPFVTRISPADVVAGVALEAAVNGAPGVHLVEPKGLT